MKRLTIGSIVVLLLVLLNLQGNASPTPDLTVIPDEGFAPIIDFISKAGKSIDFVANRLDQGPIADSLAAAARRGLHVRVMLEKNPDKGADANAAVETYLKSAHAFTSWANPNFDATMTRAIIIDSSRAMILSFDPVQDVSTGARAFAVTLIDPRDVADLVWMYDADWSRVSASPKQSSLAWEPNGARKKLHDVIANAKEFIDIYTDDIQDVEIEKALAAAVKRGVNVKALAGKGSDCPSPSLTKLNLDGGSTRCMKTLPLAVRAIIADDGHGGKTALMGISRLESPRQKETRGLGVIISDVARLNRLQEIFMQDWKAAD